MDNSTKKLKITLVRGPIVFKNGAINNEATPGVAYAYIAGYLRNKGHEITIVDAIREGLNKTWPLKERNGFSCQGLDFNQIVNRIPKDSDVIGFSAMFSGEWPVMRELIKKTRKAFPGGLFVAGGEHITALTEYSLRDCPEIDICVRGEGERKFYEVLEAHSKSKDFKNVEGTAYITKEGNYVQNRDNTPRILDVDSIPWPYWPDGYLEEFWKENKSYGISTKRDMPFMISRGCPYQCTFCSNCEMWTNRYSLRNITDIIKEIKHYMSRYSITSIQLYDLTAIVKRSWIIEFCERLIKEGIGLSWSMPSGTRSEALDGKALGLLKKTGCSYIVYAPESGSPDTLKNIKKRVNLDKLTESVMVAKEKGFTARINLIVGFPCEKWKDVFKTLFYGLKMSVMGVDEVPVFIFSPYPGTEIFKELRQKGKIELKDDYFFDLTSLNGSYLSPKIASSNENMKGWVLGVLRALFMLLNYGIGYILYPGRIFRTVGNIFSNKGSSTVLEHRMKDLLRRKKISEDNTR